MRSTSSTCRVEVAVTIRGNRRYTRSESRDLGRLHAQFRLTSSPSTEFDQSEVGSGLGITIGREPAPEASTDRRDSPAGIPPPMGDSISQSIERRVARRFWWSRG